MIRFRSCPRCKGDLNMDWDGYGWFLNCLQCGYYKDLPGEGLVGVRGPKARVPVLERVKV